jgi:predicted transcriptional regulator
MSTKPKSTAASDVEAPAKAREPGYDRWLAGEIANGVSDIEAGRVTPADKVWSELDIE